VWQELSVLAPCSESSWCRVLPGWTCEYCMYLHDARSPRDGQQPVARHTQLPVGAGPVGRLNGRRSARDALDASIRRVRARASAAASVTSCLRHYLFHGRSMDAHRVPWYPAKLGRRGEVQKSGRGGISVRTHGGIGHGRTGSAVPCARSRYAAGKTRECLRWVRISVIEQS
jgi:hypothetical protein